MYIKNWFSANTGYIDYLSNLTGWLLGALTSKDELILWFSIPQRRYQSSRYWSVDSRDYMILQELNIFRLYAKCLVYKNIVTSNVKEHKKEF